MIYARVTRIHALPFAIQSTLYRLYALLPWRLLYLSTAAAAATANYRSPLNIGQT